MEHYALEGGLPLSLGLDESSSQSLCTCEQICEPCCVHAALDEAWYAPMDQVEEHFYQQDSNLDLTSGLDLPEDLCLQLPQDMDLGLGLDLVCDPDTVASPPVSTGEPSPFVDSFTVSPVAVPELCFGELDAACTEPLPPAAPVRRQRKKRSKPYTRHKTKPAPPPACFVPGCPIQCEVIPNRATGKLDHKDGVAVCELRRESKNKVTQKNGKVVAGARARLMTVRVSLAEPSPPGAVLPRAGTSKKTAPPLAFDVLSPSGAVHRSVAANYVVSASGKTHAIFKIHLTDIVVPSPTDDMAQVKLFTLRLREAGTQHSVASVGFGVRWRSQGRKR